jgi:hypothetical protein
MKKFLILVACVALAAGCCEKKGGPAVPARAEGQTDMLGFAADPIPVVRVGFIGVGMRGQGAVERFMAIDGVEIKAVCDLEDYNISKMQRMVEAAGRPAPATYTGEDGWKKLCEQEDIDLVYICTDWLTHTPMAVYAMEQGKHAAVEVPAATTLEECWQLVDTSERTRKHCIMLENCCYDGFEMATLNMAQNGLFGEVVHVEGAYIHDLRSLEFNDRLSKTESYSVGIGSETTKEPGLAGYWDFWRKKYNEVHTGNPYPTHGLGPVCQILNIHRGDKMDYLVSVSSNQFGMTEYAKERYGEDSPEAKQPYELGDMNVTMIKTAKGKTIMIQHDVTSPRPYSRLHTVSGTKGFAQKYPVRQLAFEPDAHGAFPREKMDSMLTVWEHPFHKAMGEKAAELGRIAHGGMDFIMDSRLVYCLQKGLPLDMDVYDAAEWSCLVPLTEESVRGGGKPVEVPDFTRGAWEKLKGLQFAM